MELQRGQVAVVTGAASGIGLALAERFASAGLSVVLADIEKRRLAGAEASVRLRGVEALSVETDVSRAESVEALAAVAVERFGGVDLVCNNAGVSTRADPWLGPLSTWEWVMGDNFWGVVHGCRTFLPVLRERGGGHMVNTASVAGLLPGFGGLAYDASKHAVVAITEDLYYMVQMVGLPIGVSVLCPGWVRTSLLDADRNWPAELGERPQPNAAPAAIWGHYRRAIEEGLAPAAVADAVADAVQAGRYWVFPQPEWLDVVARRFEMIADRRNPMPAEQIPGMPPRSQLVADVRAALGISAPS
jgi:NAD(P)-dependent dehydrogenase (short-subunit alcohol dehydrogenase family)